MKRQDNSKTSSNKSAAGSEDTSSSSIEKVSEKSKSYPPETLLSLAVEAAIIGLGQQRIMPPGSHRIRFGNRLYALKYLKYSYIAQPLKKLTHLFQVFMLKKNAASKKSD